VLRIRERIPTPPFVVFTFGFAIESIKEFGGVSKCGYIINFFLKKMLWWAFLLSSNLHSFFGVMNGSISNPSIPSSTT
jgi:hypothetical protein